MNPTAFRDWTFTVHRGLTGLDELRNDWSALVQGPGRWTYLQHPAWFHSYLRGLSTQPDHMLFVAARHGTTLRGVLPIERVGGTKNALLPTYRLVSGPHMILADVVAAPDDLEFWPALTAWLHSSRSPRWTTLRLSRVIDGSCLERSLQAQPTTRALEAERPFTAWMDCSQGLDTCLKAVSKSFKQNVKRLARRADGLGQVHYEVVTCASRLEWALGEFLAVEGSGWKTQAGTDIAHDQQLVSFYRSLVQEFGRLGLCRINLLTLDGKTIAAQFGLISDRQLNLLKIGYNADHAHIAPGNLIMQHTLESVCADPSIDRLSFVTHPPWSHLWKPHLTRVRDVAVHHPGLLGGALHNATRMWRERQKRLAEAREAREAQAAEEAAATPPVEVSVVMAPETDGQAREPARPQTSMAA